MAGIDGRPLDADFGIAVSITPEQIAYDPKCAGFVWTYRLGPDGALETQRAQGFGPTRQPDGSVVVCAVAVPPEMAQLGQAIDAATEARRTPENGVRLNGGGRSATLFSQ